MPKKRKTLPKDFDKRIVSENISSLKDIFEKCDVNAYGGYAKNSALGFNDCPDALSVWLVENGADLHYSNTRGNTPLHSRVTPWNPNFDILIKLGADVNSLNNNGESPLHAAAGCQRVESAESLLAAGSEIDRKNSAGLTPLQFALQRCSNTDIPRIRDLTEIFLKYGAKITPSEQKFITDIGQNFEFHRAGFNKDSVEEVSNALSDLYEQYDVPPVSVRVTHDGVSPIEVLEGSWDKQFNHLWDILIPSTGPAQTVQGEVIRIAGKVADEMLRNGGGNWDRNYRKMSSAFIKHVSSGKALEKEEMISLESLLSDVDRLFYETSVLQKSAVAWVSKNTKPIKLEETNYDR